MNEFYKSKDFDLFVEGISLSNTYLVFAVPKNEVDILKEELGKRKELSDFTIGVPDELKDYNTLTLKRNYEVRKNA